MIGMSLPLVSFLLFFAITTAQPYKATEHFLLDCGSSSTSQKWDGDDHSEYVPSNINDISFSSTSNYLDPSVPQIPYSTARVFNSSSFTYTFPVSQGPKFLRLYFYPDTYSGLNTNQSFFSVSSNGFTLLTNFSAFLIASSLGKTRFEAGVSGPLVPHFVKEYIIYVKDTQILEVMFTPSPNSFAFINGIEIVSMPENLYFNTKNVKYIGQLTGPVVDNKTVLENLYRLNMGGGQISGIDDTGMYRSWDQDNNYIFSSAFGWMPVNRTPITYTTDTPNYSAPEQVYATQRSMGNLADTYNLTWILPIDSGFYYMLRFHFCNIIPQYTMKSLVVFTIFINNQTAEEEVDLFEWTPGSGYPVFKDYVVFIVNPNGHQIQQDLWVALHPTYRSGYLDGYLNGFEAFKLSMNRNLSSPNPELSPVHPPPSGVSSIKGSKKKTILYPKIIGGVGGGLVLITVLLVIVLHRKRRVKHYI